MLRFFETLVDPYAPYEELQTVPQKAGQFLRWHLRPYRKVLIWTVFLAVLVGLMEVGLIYYAGRVVDLASATPASEIFQKYGFEFLLIVLAVLFLRPLFMLVEVALLNNSLMPNLGTQIRWRAHRRILRQSVGWFQDDFAGRIANRVMQAAPAAGEAVFQIFDAFVYATIYLIGAMILLGETDGRLTVPLLVWFVAYAALLYFLIPRIANAAQEFSDARSLITGRIVDSYTNIQTVKLFTHAKREEEFAGEAIEIARLKFARQMRLITWMELGLIVINGLLVVGVVGWAIVLWQGGDATIGTIAAATALTLRLSAMTGWIMWAMSSFFQNMGVLQEGMETIAQPIDMLDAPDAQVLTVSGGEIGFEGVTHRYGKDAGGLDDVTLTIAPGEKVGLVGRSGAGKSTLVNLMMRFHTLERGSIRIDGTDIAQVTQDSLRAQIGMVTQDSSLLHRSVRDNILYGLPDGSDEAMFAAAKRAEACDFIEDLEDFQGRKGYDAQVGERGVKLSGGQRQRIALARVILKNAPILVLDEATSALDSEVEAAILQTLYGVMEGKTVIAIAHRLSTIAQMDRIVVLDNGRVAESGSHESLLARGGLYAGFWQRQSGGFIGIEAAQ